MNPTIKRAVSACAVAWGLLITAGAARAQGNPVQNLNPTRDMGIDQKLNARVPLDLTFRDDAGKVVRLRDYFGKKPVVLALVYYKCPRLCQLMLDGMVESLNGLKLTAGKDFSVVAVSIDPTETPAIAADKKREMVEVYGRKGSETGWHFLTGEDSQIKPLAQAVGFRYVYDARTKLYAHAAGIQVLTPTGRVFRYLNGIQYNPTTLRFALVEASQGKVGTVVDKALLMGCFEYDPTTGKYGIAIVKLLQVAGVMTFLILAGFVTAMFRLDRRRERERAASAAAAARRVEAKV
jgi:protein SCO1/2